MTRVHSATPYAQNHPYDQASYAREDTEERTHKDAPWRCLHSPSSSHTRTAAHTTNMAHQDITFIVRARSLTNVPIDRSLCYRPQFPSRLRLPSPPDPPLQRSGSRILVTPYLSALVLSRAPRQRAKQAEDGQRQLRGQPARRPTHAFPAQPRRALKAAVPKATPGGSQGAIEA